MPRDVTDADGTAWTCIQAFAGLGNDPEKTEAARVERAGDRVNVVCTPPEAHNRFGWCCRSTGNMWVTQNS